MYEELMEEVVVDSNVGRALAAVIRNRGAAGIDKMATSELEGHLKRHWEKIRAKLLSGSYGPSPVRRVEIPKAQGGVRLLGIPTVLDRFIQQLLLQVLEPIFDPGFSESSYGFRTGRSAHEAVQAAQRHVGEGKDWVVDLDIAAFFDHVNHDILMRRIAQVIRDKRVLRLIGKYLRAGAMIQGVLVRTEKGTPQGGPLSPLLANIYLDPLDRELEKRGHAFSRYADDCNIYVGSQASARRVAQTITGWIESHLKLRVNEAKSGSGRPWERKFLGFVIRQDGKIEVSPQSLHQFKSRVRELWEARQNGTSPQLRDRWLRYIRGWWNYYRLAEYRRSVFALEGWIRRHIRKCFWLRWHDWRGRTKALMRLGLRGPRLKTAHNSRGAWRLARSPAINTALNNATLRRYGFLMPSDLAAQQGR